MNKKFLSAILFGALMVSSTGTFVSCKDYDDDIDNINKELTEIKSQIAAMQTKIDAGKWITSVSSVTGGFTVAFSDGSSYTITNGKDGAAGEAGAAGTQWTISEDGYWECDGVKTEVKALGQDGEKGEAGQDAQPEVKKENGKWYLWNAETGAFEEISVDAPATANIPYYYTDPNDQNYTYLVVYDENGENELRLPMTSGLGQVVVLENSEYLTLRYHTFNGVHLSGKNATWNGPKASTLPENGKYMVTASSKAYYVQVVPANYDISKLNFKLVNTKGDEAPIKLGTPVPCTDAVSRAVSESGVYAIPFELNEMTKEVLADYEKNIKGKALSLVATESVRSTYTSALSVSAANNSFASYANVSISEDELGQDFTIVPTTSTASYVYDSFLTMADDSKADSVRYGVKIDGMTVSYSKDIKKGTTLNFVVNQLNAKAMINPEAKKYPVSVVFAKAVENKTEYTYDEQKHDAVANLEINGKKQDLQYIDVPFAKFLDAVAPTDGDKLLWYEDVNHSSYSVTWTPVDENGNLMDEEHPNLINNVLFLTSDNKSTSDFSKVATIRLHFVSDYKGVNLNNGNFVASVKFTKENGDLNVANIPFVLNNPTAATVASWYAWDKNNFINNTLTVYVADNTGRTIDLASSFSASNTSGATLNMFINKGKKDGNDWYTPNMTIGGYPYTALKATDDALKATARKEMTWTGYSSSIAATGDGSSSDLTSAMTKYISDAQLTLGNNLDKAYFNNAYTISGMSVKNLGKAVKYEKKDGDMQWVEGDDRTFAISDIKLVIVNQSASNREDKISFSKALQIAVNLDGYNDGSDYYGYVRLSNSAYTPNSGSFFGTFTLADYADNVYTLADNATITVYDQKADGTYETTASTVFSAANFAYGYGKSTDETPGIMIKYLKKVNYSAGKDFPVKLVISKATADGNAKDNVTVYTTIKVGGI